MENDNDLFDDVEEIVDPIIENDDTTQISSEELFESDDILESQPSLMDEFLKLKGITDSKVTIIGEDEKEEVVDFYSLSKEEQLEILNTAEAEELNDLDSTEIDLINHLRTNGLSVDTWLEQYKEKIIAEMSQPVEASYDIDAYDSQELFLLDLKNRYDLTDEQLVVELEKELQNEELFNKKTTKLREEYKQLEDEYKSNQLQEAETQKEAQYNQFADQMVTIATKTTGYHGIELEDNEKNETLSYLLELDDKGISSFYKDLNNPTKLYEAAWYLRYGKEAFEALEKAYETEITRLKKTDKPRVVVQNAKKQITNIHDF